MDTEVTFQGGSGLRIAGVLAIPPYVRDGISVVLVGGSGPSTRDNDGFFVPLRKHLRNAGIMVLSYDKRGVGDSQGGWETATVDDLAADACAALAFLRHQPGTNPDRASIFGHSEGGWVALRACLEDEPPALMVLNSCPGVSFIDSEVFAQERAGLSPIEASEWRRLLGGLVKMADDGQCVHAARHQLDGARQQTWFQRVEAAGFDLTDTMWSQLRAWGSYDPGVDLRQCGVTTRALFGGDDPLVPVDDSIKAYDRTAALAGRSHANRVFPGAGHRMSSRDSAEPVPGYLEYVRRSVVSVPSGRGSRLAPGEDNTDHSRFH